MKKLYPALLLVLILLLPKPGLAQDELATGDLLFFKNHLAFTAGLNYPMLTVNNVQGGSGMLVYGRPGGYLGFRFTANLHPNFGIEAGTQAGLQTYGYEFKGEGDFGSKQTWINPYLAFPVLFSPRFLINDKHIIGVQAGVTLHYYIPLATRLYLDENGDAPGGDILEMELNVRRNNPYADIDFGFSYGLVMKNLNIVRVGLNYSLGSKTLLQGSYKYRENDYIKETGEIIARNTYVSMDVHYIFTRAERLKKKMAYYSKMQREKAGK